MPDYSHRLAVILNVRTCILFVMCTVDQRQSMDYTAKMPSYKLQTKILVVFMHVRTIYVK